MRMAMIAALLTGSGLATVAQAQSVERIENGVAVTPRAGPQARVEVTVHGDGIFHVVATPRIGASAARTPSLMAPKPPAPSASDIQETRGHVRINAAKATADIDTATGRVRFLDRAGRETLAEAGAPAFRPITVDGLGYVAVSQQFNRATDEGLYGLGQHQNAQMDYNGEDVELAQHNMDIAVPFVVSTKNYGLLWDNNGIGRFGNPQPYALAGDTLKVTNGGKPGWRAEYSLDGKPVVTRQEATIDYQYLDDQGKWPEAAKAKTEAATGGQNTAGNAVQKQTVVWTGDVWPTVTGTHKFQLYGSSYFKVFVNGREVLNRWRQNWNPWYANFGVALTKGRKAAVRIEWEPNAGYIALLHSDPLPAPDRKSVWFTSDVGQAKDYWYVPGTGMDDVVAGYRQLTGKSEMMPKWAYGFWQSRQRYDTADDVTGVVDKYRALGIPLDNIVLDWRYNWTHDIGGFALEDRFAGKTPKPQDLDEWRELNLRWFQFGAFSPLFRSHGEPPFREIYEISPEGSAMRASMVWYDKLRYRLMPYIYTLGADTFMKDGSIIRGLAMDFPADVKARGIADQYLFGDAFLVAPVTDYQARTRAVYFPGKAGWYDFSTGAAYRGGTRATVAAPYERMPLFVRAGAIVPMGPVTQYVDQQRDAPLTIAVYAGADGRFSLYEDDGRSTAYKSGAFSRIPIAYDDATGTVTIGAREGAGWKGMPERRTLRVKWLRAGQPVGDDGAYDVEVTYTGGSTTVRRR